MRSKRDGQPIPGTERTITADEQRRALGLDAAAPKPAKLPLTPAQARRAMSDEWVGDDLDPPDWEASVVSDPNAIANALGLRPADFEGAPLGRQPEGQPIEKPGFRPKPEAKPERTNWEAIDAAKATPEPDPAAIAEELRAMAAEHTRRQIERTKAAIASGDPERQRAAAAEAEKSSSLTRKILSKINGSP